MYFYGLYLELSLLTNIPGYTRNYSGPQRVSRGPVCCAPSTSGGLSERSHNPLFKEKI